MTRPNRVLSQPDHDVNGNDGCMAAVFALMGLLAVLIVAVIATFIR